MVDVVVIGDANPDLILSGDDVVPIFGQAEKLVSSAAFTLGGSGAITAAGLARLGLSVAMVAAVGDDDLGELTIEQLVDAGVDTSHMVIKQLTPTGISVHLLAQQDRAILTHPGAIDSLTIDDIDSELISSARHVHASSVFLVKQLRPYLAELLRIAAAAGASTSLDCNWDPAEEWHIPELLEACDLFLPNESEVLKLSGRTDLDSALKALSATVPTIAMKAGADGGVVMAEGGVETIAAAPVVEIVDSIGAGDCFDAGYIRGLLSGFEPKGCLGLAVACGSLSLRGPGGTSTLASLNEAASLAAELAVAP